MAYHKCPHCKRINAWYELLNEFEIVERCWCGRWRVVYTEVEGELRPKVLPKNKVVMPHSGTKLSKCLGTLASFEQHTGTTGQIAEKLELKGADAASQLMVLQHKGLVSKTMDRRGKPGGSTWVLTDRAIQHLKLKS